MRNLKELPTTLSMQSTTASTSYYEKTKYTEDSMMELVSQEQKFLKTCYESQTADITVTDEDVKAEYDRLVAEDKSNYEADYSAFESVASYGDEQYYYAPEGFPDDQADFHRV